MASIALSEIPTYLRTGAFYKSLNLDDENEVIQVPEGCFKADTSIANVDDFKALLDTVMYWGVDDLLPVFLNYCCAHDPSVWSATVLGVADSELRSDLLLVSEKLHSKEGALSAAMGKERTELFNYFCDNKAFACTSGYYKLTDFAKVAVIMDNVGYLKLLHKKGFLMTRDASRYAARMGKLDCLKYFYAVAEKDDDGEYVNKDSAGCVEENITSIPVGYSMECCATSGHLETLAFLLEKFEDEIPEKLVWVAARAGDIACLRMLHAAGLRHDDLLEEAVDDEFGAHVLKYLHEEAGHEFPEELVENYLSDYTIESLRYIIEQGCEYDADEILQKVINDDQSACLEYFVETLHMPIADKIESGQEFGPCCKAYLEKAGWLSTDANKKPRVD